MQIAFNSLCVLHCCIGGGYLDWIGCRNGNAVLGIFPFLYGNVLQIKREHLETILLSSWNLLFLVFSCFHMYVHALTQQTDRQTSHTNYVPQHHTFPPTFTLNCEYFRKVHEIQFF